MSHSTTNNNEFREILFEELKNLFDSMSESSVQNSIRDFNEDSFEDFKDVYFKSDFIIEVKGKTIDDRTDFLILGQEFLVRMYKTFFNFAPHTEKGKGPFFLEKEKFFEVYEEINSILNDKFSISDATYETVKEYFESRDEDENVKAFARYLMYCFINVYGPIFQRGIDLIDKGLDVSESGGKLNVNNSEENFAIIVKAYPKLKGKSQDVAIKFAQEFYTNRNVLRLKFRTFKKIEKTPKRIATSERKTGGSALSALKNLRHSPSKLSTQVSSPAKSESTQSRQRQQKRIGNFVYLDTSTSDNMAMKKEPNELQMMMRMMSTVKNPESREVIEDISTTALVKKLDDFFAKMSTFKLVYSNKQGTSKPNKILCQEEIDTDTYKRCIIHSGKGASNFPYLSERSLKKVTSGNHTEEVVYGYLTKNLECYDSCYRFETKRVSLTEFEGISSSAEHLKKIIRQLDIDIGTFNTFLGKYNTCVNVEVQENDKAESAAIKISEYRNQKTIKSLNDLFKDKTMKEQKERVKYRRNKEREEFFWEKLDPFEYELKSSFICVEDDLFRSIEHKDLRYFISPAIGTYKPRSDVSFLDGIEFKGFLNTFEEYIKSKVNLQDNMFTDNNVFLCELTMYEGQLPDPGELKANNFIDYRKDMLESIEEDYHNEQRLEFLEELNVDFTGDLEELKLRVENFDILKRSIASDIDSNRTKIESFDEQMKKIENDLVRVDRLIKESIEFMEDPDFDEEADGENILEEIEMNEKYKTQLKNELSLMNSNRESIVESYENEIERLRSEEHILNGRITICNEIIKNSDYDITAEIANLKLKTKDFKLSKPEIGMFSTQKICINVYDEYGNLDKTFELAGTTLYNEIVSNFDYIDFVRSFGFFFLEVVPDIKIPHNISRTVYESYENKCYSLGREILCRYEIGKNVRMNAIATVNTGEKLVTVNKSFTIYKYPYKMCMDIGSIFLSNKCDLFLRTVNENTKIQYPWMRNFDENCNCDEIFMKSKYKYVKYKDEFEKYSVYSTKNRQRIFSNFKTNILNILLGFYNSREDDFLKIYHQNHSTHLYKRKPPTSSKNEFSNYVAYKDFILQLKTIDQIMIYSRYRLLKRIKKMVYDSIFHVFGDLTMELSSRSSDFVKNVQYARKITESRYETLKEFDIFKSNLILFKLENKPSVSSFEIFLQQSNGLVLFSKKTEFSHAGLPGNEFPFFRLGQEITLSRFMSNNYYGESIDYFYSIESENKDIPSFDPVLFDDICDFYGLNKTKSSFYISDIFGDLLDFKQLIESRNKGVLEVANLLLIYKSFVTSYVNYIEKIKNSKKKNQLIDFSLNSKYIYESILDSLGSGKTGITISIAKSIFEIGRTMYPDAVDENMENYLNDSGSRTNTLSLVKTFIKNLISDTVDMMIQEYEFESSRTVIDSFILFLTSHNVLEIINSKFQFYLENFLNASTQLKTTMYYLDEQNNISEYSQDISTIEDVDDTSEVNNVFSKLEKFKSALETGTTYSIDYNGQKIMDIYSRVSLFKNVIEYLKIENMSFERFMDMVSLHVFNNNTDILKQSYSPALLKENRGDSSLDAKYESLFEGEEKIILEKNRSDIAKFKSDILDVVSSTYDKSEKAHKDALTNKKTALRKMQDSANGVKNMFVRNSSVANLLVNKYSSVKSDYGDIESIIENLSTILSVYDDKMSVSKITHSGILVFLGKQIEKIYKVRYDIYKEFNPLSTSINVDQTEFSQIFLDAIFALRDFSERIFKSNNGMQLSTYTAFTHEFIQDDVSTIRMKPGQTGKITVQDGSYNRTLKITDDGSVENLRLVYVKNKILNFIIDDNFYTKIFNKMAFYSSPKVELPRSSSNKINKDLFEKKFTNIDNVSIEEYKMDEECYESLSKFIKYMVNFTDYVISKASLVNQASGFYFIINILEILVKKQVYEEGERLLLLDYKHRLANFVSDLSSITRTSEFEDFVAIINGTFDSPQLESYIHVLGLDLKNVNLGYKKYTNVTVEKVAAIFNYIQNEINESITQDKIRAFLVEHDLDDQDLIDLRSSMIRMRDEKLGTGKNNETIVLNNDNLVLELQKYFSLKGSGECFVPLYDAMYSAYKNKIYEIRQNMVQNVVMILLNYFEFFSESLSVTHSAIEHLLLK